MLRYIKWVWLLISVFTLLLNSTSYAFQPGTQAFQYISLGKTFGHEPIEHDEETYKYNRNNEFHLTYEILIEDLIGAGVRFSNNTTSGKIEQQGYTIQSNTLILYPTIFQIALRRAGSDISDYNPLRLISVYVAYGFGFGYASFKNNKYHEYYRLLAAAKVGVRTRDFWGVSIGCEYGAVTGNWRNAGNMKYRDGSPTGEFIAFLSYIF